MPINIHYLFVREIQGCTHRNFIGLMPVRMKLWCPNIFQQVTEQVFNINSKTHPAASESVAQHTEEEGKLADAE